MRVALAQIASSVDPSENLDLVRDQTRRVAEQGADLVVFPEATMASFARPSREVAEEITGPWATGVIEIAHAAGISVVAGMFTREGNRVRNTLLAVTAGEVVTYDKIHLYDAFGFRESDHIEPGSEPRTVTIGGATAGLATCYDIRFPDLFTTYALAGAQMAIVPASWGSGPRKLAQWRALTVARALDSTCFVVACGQADPRTVGYEQRVGDPTGLGHSMVVSPLGDVLAEAGDAPELLVVELEPADVHGARRSLPVLENARFRATLT